MKSILAEGKSTLAGHISSLMLNGTITADKVYGVQSGKKKAKRTGMQGFPGTKGGNTTNKPLTGNSTGTKPSKSDVNKGAVLKAGMPKTEVQNLAAPKKTSKFVMAFEAAKKSLHTSTDSRAKAGGARPTKSPNASTKGAGVD